MAQAGRAAAPGNEPAAADVDAGPGFDAGAYAKPPLCCDIVMKGGITSGVVYPGAILSLARRYRFRSIGGTSAGAIAAAVLAAAEHCRRPDSTAELHDRTAGFRVIHRLPTDLGGAPGADPLMLQLFQADAPTRPLFAAAVRFMRLSRLRASLGLVQVFWRSACVALAVGVASILLSAFGDADPAFAVGGVAASFAMLLVGVVAEVLRAVRRIADNDFGLCRLGPEVGTEDKPALTGWLHERIQEAAGLAADAPPLTFSQLWGAGAGTGPASADPERLACLRDRCRSPDRRSVDLQMMTTDLTLGRPLRLPVSYERHSDALEDDAGRLLFDPVELRRFFPGEVVDHLVLCAEPYDNPAIAAAVTQFERDTFGHEGAAPRLRRMPIGADLPVIVATRMSLSFPLLISVVPLWRVVTAEGAAPSVQRAIFSDGGITSNFPIHFFDTPLPTRPTFGLHLTSFAPGEPIDVEDTRACVTPPSPSGAPAIDRTRDISDLRGFAVALKDATQNWRDNAQARLPGFRDRISHIKLAEGEGGMNLTMEPDVLARLDARGALAGEDLRGAFSGTGDQPAYSQHWNDHRFTRYRVTMAVMERLLRSYRDGYAPAQGVDAITTPYETRVRQGETAQPYPLGSEQRRKQAAAATGAYVDLAESWPEDHLDDAGVPPPPAVMRTVPPV